jgi:hypothetical protein
MELAWPDGYQRLVEELDKVEAQINPDKTRMGIWAGTRSSAFLG